MIITDKFVYIHLPKTGGTFVEKIIEKIYRNMGITKHLSFVRYCFNSKKSYFVNFIKQGKYFQHGTINQIPPNHREKVILATVRNPFDLYVSQYEFGLWKNNPSWFRNYDNIIEICPRFPNISFREFVYLRNGNYGKININNFIGYQSINFIKFFTFHSEKFCPLIKNNETTCEEIKKSIVPAKFLYMEELNKTLYEALSCFVYKNEHINFILHEEKIFPRKGGRKTTQKWHFYYDEGLYNYVKHKENFILSLFTQYDKEWVDIAHV